MILQKIVLTHFRNFDQKVFELSPSITVIIGQNARGKTNLLEAVHVAIHGVGFRESREEELLSIGETIASLQLRFINKDSFLDFQIYFKKHEDHFEKKYMVSKSKKTHTLYVRETPGAVLFSPEQIIFMTGAPDIRRDYFNKLLSAFDPQYKKSLLNYENALRKRNKLFEQIHDVEKLKMELVFWNDYLLEQANYISSKRKAYLSFLNSNPRVDHKEFKITYLQNEFSKRRLAEYFEKERWVHRTLIGPQKDDFLIEMKNEKDFKNLHHFGSRSEQRLALFWLKLNEVIYYETILSRRPILLLDDIFSELDHKNKKLILHLITKYQTIMTTTEEEVLGLIENPYVKIEL